MSWVAVAIGGSALVGAGASMYSSSKASKNNAIDFYQTRSYQAINKRLREDIPVPEKLQTVIDNLNSSFTPSD